MGSSTENSAFGVTRNPWDPDRVPGGSSGGSSAAVAAGFAPLALGTDTGGSIRQPAALCGVVGMKPTYGAVSRYGLIAFASSLDQIGPFALTVRDCALLLQVICGKDECDATSVELPEPIAVPDAQDLRGVRIGVPSGLLEQGIEPGVRDAFDAGIRSAGGLGAEVVEVELPHAGYALPAYYLIAPAEASANLSRFDGVRYGLRREEDGDTIIDMYGRTRADGFGAEVKRRIMLGTYALSAGYYDAYYGMAQKVRTRIRDDFQIAFEACDLIAMPTSPTVAFRIGERVGDPWAMYASDVLTVPVNLAGLPGISLPCGLSEGLPVGFQLVGPAFAENRILSAAHALEGALGFDPRPAAAAEASA
jgi:aspartyl-tRNA(Asn)/glutamyl-tRNA(Gln) amidotransferase subunit A